MLRYKKNDDGETLVEVYDANDVKYKRPVVFSGWQEFEGIAFCQNYNCLYVSQTGKPNCINRVDLADSSVSQWALDHHPRQLLVTPSHHLLVVLCEKLREYSNNGVMTREITFNASIDCPQHCLELPSGLIIVCHGLDEEHRVCVIDTSGRIIRSYGGLDDLDFPSCLEVDGSGCVLRVITTELWF